MRKYLYTFIFLYALTACDQKGVTINDKQTETLSLKMNTDTLARKDLGQLVGDGWPEDLPKDTLTITPLKTYPNEINSAILESTSKKIGFKKMNIRLLEVYHCTAWDGEKWYTTENDYSVLVCDKNSTNNSHWIISVEYINGKYTVGEWIMK